MHLDDKWQIFKLNGEPEDGQWMLAEATDLVENQDKMIGCVVVWLYRLNAKGELEILWQKRGEKVNHFPGFWDVSAGGHINLGESKIEAAIRETKEEIGVKITAEDLQFGFASNTKKNRFWWIYFVDFTGRDDEFKFEDGEVSEVKWVKYDELAEFWQNKAKPPLKADETSLNDTIFWLKSHGNL